LNSAGSVASNSLAGSLTASNAIAGSQSVLAPGVSGSNTAGVMAQAMAQIPLSQSGYTSQINAASGDSASVQSSISLDLQSELNSIHSIVKHAADEAAQTISNAQLAAARIQNGEMVAQKRFSSMTPLTPASGTSPLAPALNQRKSFADLQKEQIAYMLSHQ